MSSGTVRIDRTDSVAVVTLHDPDRRNALTPDLSRRLAGTIADCENDEAIGAVVVTGEPPAFCAGADLSALGEARESGLREIYSGFLAVADCRLPTVAAVGGAAVGAGLNLALACDIRVATVRARFDARFLQLGLHPGGGMTWMLQGVAGIQTAKAMVLFGQSLDGSDAERTGLVWRVIDGDHQALLATAVEIAAAAASAPRPLVVTTKATMARTAAMDDHATAVEAEIGAQLASIETPDFAARIAAVKAKVAQR